MVTAIGERSVSLTIFAPDNRGGIPKDGVRHCSDPDNRMHPGYDGGSWDFLPSEIAIVGRLMALEAEIAELQNSITR
jgi:hypothetical protein